MTTENKDKHIVFSYGRMNPPTAGHSKVVDKVKSHADAIGANHAVIVSHSQNQKDNPLHHEHKKEFLKHVHPDVNFEHSTKEHPHFLAQLKKFHQEGHTHATMVVGSDRVKQFKALAHKYNGKEYDYKKIHILSAGQRDPDAEGVTGISGTKMRNHASNNDYKSFKAGLHANHNDEQAKKLFKATRQGMNLQKEERGMKDFATFLTEDMEGMSQKSGDKRSTESGAGMTAKGVAKYNRRTGGNLKTAVTTPPSKLKKGSKAAGRRKSFCARSKGWTGERGKAARRRWNC
jgi:nicotinic acid mononucleotide adenylyltransferase